VAAVVLEGVQHERHRDGALVKPFRFGRWPSILGQRDNLGDLPEAGAVSMWPLWFESEMLAEATIQSYVNSLRWTKRTL
jgi:hypothetical protein